MRLKKEKSMSTKNNPGKFDCYANADPDEPMFVLLGRDPMAGYLVRFWAAWRLQMGEDADKVENANACAGALNEWAEKLGKQPLVPEYKLHARQRSR
jgi:hypothetical protein